VGVTETSLPDFVGKPVFTSDRLYELTPPGIVTRLAWTSMGGYILFIEAALSRALDTTADSKDQGSFVVTGHLEYEDLHVTVLPGQ
jgi:Lon-like ATP-dependent protease